MINEAIPTEQSSLSAQGLNQINQFTMEGHSCLSGELDSKIQTEVRFSKTFKSLIVGKKINKLSLAIFTDKAAEIVDIRSQEPLHRLTFLKPDGIISRLTLMKIKKPNVSK